MSLRPFLLLCLLAASIGALYVTATDYPSANNQTVQLMQTLADKNIFTPPPLRRDQSQIGGPLTISGIMAETNRHRAESGLPPLSGHATLNQAAQNKLADMFAQQYFDHINPNNVGPADLVDKVGYAYLRVGENLALGGFTDDADLVQAWMDSPGHRENILSASFSELGLAAQLGTFEGKPTWLAVQTFALPASACPAVDLALQTSFDQNKQQTEQLQPTLDALQAEFASLSEQGQAKLQEGNRLIKQGNQLAQDQKSNTEAQSLWDQGEALQSAGQSLINQAKAARDSFNEKLTAYTKSNAAAKSLADQLNSQIRAYNDCLNSF